MHLGQLPCVKQNPLCQGGLPGINVSRNTDIPNVLIVFEFLRKK